MSSKLSYSRPESRMENTMRRRQVRVVDHSQRYALATGILLTLLFAIDYYWLTAVGIGLVGYSLVWYIESLGKDAAILQIMLLIATLQWLLGPFIAYHFEGTTYKYYMYVPEEEYMQFAVPALLAFIIGLRLFSTPVNYAAVTGFIKSSKLLTRKKIYLLILIGFLADAANPYMPAGLRFVLFIVSQFKYIGVVYLLVLQDRYRWIVLAGVVFLTILSSAESGMFHNLILWSAFIFSYICMDLKLSRGKKYLLIIISAVLLISLQSIKGGYREIVKMQNYTGSKIILLTDMMLNPDLYSSDASLGNNIGMLNARLNQGWIISAVMENVPKRVEFQQGETVVDAFMNSFLPRILVDKKKVSVSENFERFSGLTVSDSTSMGISILGEAYVNFGSDGGTLFMFFWGALISGAYRLLVNISRIRPTVIFWAPLLFLQMVKAETELVVVLNHGVKTAILIFLFYWAAKKFLGWRI